MTLSYDVRHQLGTFTIDARFEAGPGVVALFGRSGSGKSSVINVIAGLIRPDRGRISIDGETLVDTERGICVPTHRRRIGYVFQEGRLFPHLTVRQNLLYGRWFAPPQGAGGGELDRVVGLLGLEKLLERRPAKLSGGEKQRVAIGRALLADPRLLLMDEPLSSLDEERKAEIMPYIERLRDVARMPIIYVSHSIPEVARLASSVVLLADGKVAATGPTLEIMHRIELFPLTGRADAGALVEATVTAHDARLGLTDLTARSGTWRLPTLKAAVGTHLRLRIRARDVMLAKSAPTEVSALNVLQGTVTEMSGQEGPVVDVRIDCQGDVLIARLTRFSADRLGLAPGVPVHAVIKSVSLDRRSLSGPGDTATSDGAVETDG